MHRKRYLHAREIAGTAFVGIAIGQLISFAMLLMAAVVSHSIHNFIIKNKRLTLREVLAVCGSSLLAAILISGLYYMAWKPASDRLGLGPYSAVVGNGCYQVELDASHKQLVGTYQLEFDEVANSLLGRGTVYDSNETVIAEWIMTDATYHDQERTMRFFLRVTVFADDGSAVTKFAAGDVRFEKFQKRQYGRVWGVVSFYYEPPRTMKIEGFRQASCTNTP